MRDCANCFHRKPVLKEDGTWTAECEKWDCEFQSRENMVEKTEAKQDDLISREALKKAICLDEIISIDETWEQLYDAVVKAIDNAPTVDIKDEIAGAYNEGYMCGNREAEKARLQGKYFDMSKLRLMKVEECAGHTIEYAMGWKACIEWIKKGGAE